ncbi:MAG: MopE-related protein [Minicystis sp.]
MKRALGFGIAAAAVILAAATSGCTTEAFCFDCSGGTGGHDAGTQDASGGGGHGGGEITISGTGGHGGGFNPGCTADTQTDPKNCGSCGNVCNLPNAFPACVNGFCAVATCAPGYVDLDTNPVNGCEYTCAETNGGVEVCDGQDNDCNGMTDELTDTTTDPFNCGGCDNACEFTHAAPLCQGGTCKMGPCLVGYHDINQSDADGCEYACTPTNGGVEICDGKDNDCNGQTDEGFDVTTDAKNCGACGNDCGALYPHAAGVCASGVCAFGSCLAGYFDLDGNAQNGCEYACTVTNGGVEICDGKDNDCNGVADDGTLAGVGDPCGTSSVGECKLGAQVCKGGALMCVGAIDPATELCDGHDNNCNGMTDEGCPVVAAADKRLDVGTNSAVGQAPTTQLEVAARGDLLLAAYLDRRSGGADIRANVSQDGGLTWLTTSDIGVATSAATQVEPSPMLGQTNAYIAYGEFNGTNRDVYVARAAPPFSTFTPVRADKDATGADAFFIRGLVAKPGASDVLVVVWEGLNGTGSSVTTDVWVQRSLDGGVTWNATDLRVNSVAGGAELPVAATDGNGHVIIAWRDNRNGKAEVYADVYDAAAGTLSGNKAISGGQAAEGIVIAADAGGPNAYVAWTDLRAAKKAIRVNHSSNGGVTFAADGAVVNVDSTFANATTPAIVSAGGRVVVAWEDTRSGLPDIRVNRSLDAGVTWLATTSRADLGDTPGAAASTSPRLALGAGNRVFVAWEDARNGQRDIYANHALDLGVTFQPFDLRLDVGLSGAPSAPGGADSRAPRMLTNAGGTRGVAVWIDYRTTAGVTGQSADVYANYFQ